MEFVIVDIETTGGNPKQGGITEIAAIVSDGKLVLDKFHTLINPEQYIPNFITGLTGIDQSMVENSPTFHEIAEQLFQFLKGRIFVAHNVNFDYSFLKESFKSSGIEFQEQKLCTVRLSRKAFPGYKSYSLGRICEHLSIVISDRHRAFGDAEATTVLFHKVLEKCPEIIFQSLKKGSGDSFLPPHIPLEKYQQIPENTGIYYFHNQKGEVIYVGKALNIKSRFKGHFSGNSDDKLKLKSEIHDITWELTGSEFLAYLLETLEIKRLWPKFNRALKYNNRQWALFQYEDHQGYIRFQVSKNNQKLPAISTFDSHAEAWNFMIDQTEKFDLCPKLTGIQKSNTACYDFKVEKCQGACVGLESPKIYNLKAKAFTASILSEKGSILIKDKGTNPEESCALLFENGVFTAYAFISQDEFLDDNEAILNRLGKVKPVPETKYILRSFISKIHFRNIIPVHV